MVAQFKNIEDLTHCTAYLVAEVRQVETEEELIRLERLESLEALETPTPGQEPVELWQKKDTHHGTSFFFNLKIGDRVEELLVTCKHNVEYFTKGHFILSLLQGEGRLQDQEREIRFSRGNAQWLYLPGVDLAALRLTPILAGLESDGTRFDRPALTDTMIAEPSAMALADDILMIGYPDKNRDEENNLPLLSKGSISTHPANSFNSQNVFVICAPSYGGFSGSPVFSYESVRRDGFSPRLLGILCGGINIDVRGQLQLNENDDSSYRHVAVPIPSSFGMVIPAGKLLDFRKYLR